MLTNKFTDVGLPLGIIIFVAVAFFVTVTTYMLLDCHIHCSAIANKELQSFEDIAGFTLGKYGRRTIRYSIALLQLLFCTGFMIVFCDNMEDVFPVLNRAEYAAVALIPLTFLSWIPSMRDMWIVSVLGLVVYLVGVIGLSTYDGVINYERPDDLMKWKFAGAPSFFGVCAYAIEGICLVIPTAVTLKKQEDTMGVVTLALVLYIAITLAFASFTFAAGLGECDSVVECLDHGFMTTGVRLALCGALLLTHPVFIIVVATIVEGRMFADSYSPLVELDTDKSYSSKRDTAKTSPGFTFIDTSPRSIRIKTIRFILVGITCGIAASGIKFSVFSGLVGSVLTSFVGFVMPAIMWWQLYRVVGIKGLPSDEEGDIITPLLADTPQQSKNETSSSVTTRSLKSSLFSLLTPSSSIGGFEQPTGRGIFEQPISPTPDDPSRDWVYSSFIPESDAPSNTDKLGHDVVLMAPPIVKSESDTFLLASNSGDSVDSRDQIGASRSGRKTIGGSKRSWFGRLFDSMGISGDSSHLENFDGREVSCDSAFTPDSRKSSVESTFAKSGAGSFHTRESIYDYEIEAREPSNASKRYRLPALTIWGHAMAFFFVILGVVAMIAGGISGVHDLTNGA